MMQRFCDLDGVLADFDRHHLAVFGTRPCKIADNVNWGAVCKVKNFYLGIPPMPDRGALWARIEPYRPIVLTGIPRSVPEAAENERAWVRRHLGEDVPVICCRAKEKSLHAAPGDILIEDWIKYRHLWIEKGGRWITHVTGEGAGGDGTLALSKAALGLSRPKPTLFCRFCASERAERPAGTHTLLAPIRDY